MESGVPDYEIAGWFGILAPAGVPPAITQRLRDEVAKAVAAPDVVATARFPGHAATRHAAQGMARLHAPRARALRQDHQGRQHQAGIGLTPQSTKAQKWRRPASAVCVLPRLVCPERKRDACQRSLDRSLRRQLPVVERDTHHQGHGALRRGRARGDGSCLRAAAATPAGAAGLAGGMGCARGGSRAQGRRGGRRRPRASPPATTTCAPATTTTTPSASSCRARRKREWRTQGLSLLPCRASGCVIRASSSSRCPTRASPCRRCS